MNVGIVSVTNPEIVFISKSSTKRIFSRIRNYSILILYMLRFHPEGSLSIRIHIMIYQRFGRLSAPKGRSQRIVPISMYYLLF